MHWGYLPHDMKTKVVPQNSSLVHRTSVEACFTGPTVISLATDHRTSGFRDDWAHTIGKTSEAMVLNMQDICNMFCMLKCRNSRYNWALATEHNSNNWIICSYNECHHLALILACHLTDFVTHPLQQIKIIMKQQSEIANLPKFSMIVLLLSLLISTFYFLSQFLRVFKPEVVTEVESNIKIGHAIPYISRFCSTF